MNSGQDKQMWLLFLIVVVVMLIEFIYAYYKRDTKSYHAKNTITNFSIGIFERFTSLVITYYVFLSYDFIQKAIGLISFDTSSIWTWVFAFFAFDFWWYVYHRMGHRVNVFWGAHVVHHQSEDYNYSVALTITPIQAFIKFFTWAMMPLIGFPIEVIVIMYAANGLYQFWIHSKYIPKLGWFETLFVTPSHHRVHHGSNEQYIDKNFGGTLIIWDKMFGSFAEEQEEVNYGITKSIDSRTLGASLFHYYRDLNYRAKQLNTVAEKLRLFFSGPEWQPAGRVLDNHPIYQEKYSYNYEISSGVRWYSYINIGLLLSLTAVVSYYMPSIAWWEYVALFGFMLSSLSNIGFRLEKKSYWVYVEILKWGFLALFICLRWVL